MEQDLFGPVEGRPVAGFCFLAAANDQARRAIVFKIEHGAPPGWVWPEQVPGPKVRILSGDNVIFSV